MIKAENKENSRSVEHLIPNTVLTRKRNNNEGDFYACRKCNSRKSHIDYVLGIVAKSQADDSDLAVNTLINAINKNDGASKRFINMIQGVRKLPDESHMTIPIRGKELVEYIEFLGKGQYFKKNRIPFNPNKHVFKMLFANKPFIRMFQESYNDKHKSNPFRDLEQNKYSEIINNGECIIYSKNKDYMFSFHDYTVITVRVLNKSRKNIAICSEKTKQLISDFNELT